MSMYLGSNMFNGTVVYGNIIKLDKGNIGIFFGKISFLFIKQLNKIFD